MKALTFLSILFTLAASSASLFGQSGVVEFDSPTYSVNEQAAYRTVNVRRTGGSAGAITVNYATADGTAVASTLVPAVTGDYIGTTGTLAFANGETEKVITVQIASDSTVETAETFSLTLTGPQVGGIATTVFTINDTPTITGIAGQTTAIGTPTAAIPFTVGDAETVAGDITLSATSSNPQLVPVENIVFGGSGAARTVTVTPAASLSGTSRIYIIAKDANGAEVTSNFSLQVGNATSATAIAITDTTPADSVPNVTVGADDSFTVNYTVTNSAWVTNVTFVELDNANLIGAHGTGSTSDLRTQPGTSGATARSLRIRGRDNSTEVGEYGTANITLGFTGAGAPTNSHTFGLRVNPRAQADNNLLGVPGTTSTFDVLANDAKPLVGHNFSITGVSGASNGTLTISPDGKTLLYTPTDLTSGIDRFSYTITVNSSDAFNGYTFTGQAYVKIGGYVVVDSPTASQHIDLDFDFINGEWIQRIRTDAVIAGSVESGTFGPSIHDSDEGVIFFDPSTKIARSAGSILDPLGVPAGADVWFGPTSSSGNKVYLGIANESTSGIDSYTPAGDPRATSNSAWVRTDLVAFSGPGHFAAFNGSSLAFDTFDGVNPTTGSETTSGDNSNVSDTFWGFSGSHAHPAWYFTAPGRYELTFRSTVRVGGVFVTSPDTVFTFDVDTMSGNARLRENPPTLANDATTIVEDSPATMINVLANDSSNPDGYEKLAITATSAAANGTVAIAGDALSLTYTPALNFAGSDSFTYTVADEHGGTGTATVNVTVTPVNDMPSFVKGANQGHAPGTTGSQSFTNWATSISDGDAGVEQALTFNVNVTSGASIFSTAPAISSVGTLSYTLSGTPGTAQLSVTLTDDTTAGTAALTTAAQTFTVSVASSAVVPFTTPNFQDPNVTSSGSAQLADLNGDGKLDMVTSAGGYLLGVGDGTFQPRQDLPDSEGLRNDIVAVDYDGDGDIDLLVSKPHATDTTTDTLMLFRNNGSATFTAVPLVTLPRLSTQLEAGDFNGDGRVDVVYGKATTAVAYALQQPDGSLGTEVVLPVTTTTSTVKVADIDADGDVDIVVGNRTGSNAGAISVFKNSGSGTFNLAQTVATGNFPTVLMLTDMNGDGRMDIVSTQLIANTRVGWYPQAADGTFGARVNVMTAISQLNSMDVGDVNGDGIPDIVAAANTLVGSTLTFTSVWSPGLGGGAYGNPILLDANQGNSTALFVADLDGDAHPDIIATGNSDSTKPSAVRVLINKTGENPMVLTPPAARIRVGGDPIELSVYFGFPITVTGSPRIALNLGANTVYAIYVSGSGTGTLTFRYTVAATDMDLDGVQLASNVIELNGGTLTNPLGGAAVLEFPNLSFTGVVVNAAGPLVQSITRVDSQATTAGTVRFSVQFAEAVTGVDATDFTVRMVEGDLAGAVITGLTGSGSLYEVTVSTGTGSGTLGLSVKDGASINDLNGDVLALGYAGGQVYTVRKQPVAPSDNYYTDAHADYRPIHDNGEFSYVWHGDPGVLPQIEYASDEVITYLDNTSIVTRAAGANYDFIGVGANQPLYLSNSSGNIASVPFLGWSGESLVANDFAEYRPAEDPRITSATLREYVKVQMVGFRSDSGGEFSLFSGTTPTVWFATSDGIGANDNIWLYRTHFHRETAFSKPGKYEIDVVISGYLDGNGNNALDATDVYVESGIKTMVFHVDTLGTVNDSFNVVEGNTLNGNVSSNDNWHVSMGAYAASIQTGPAHGALTLNANGTFTYQPNAGFAGPDSFVYRLTNERGGFTTATTSITVVANRAVPFALPTYFGGEVSTSVGSSSAADLNGDGRIDLVYGGPSGTPLRWAAGTGNGGFLAEQGITVGLGLGTNAVTTVDYDGDGDIDVLSVDLDSATQGGTASNGMVSLYRNDGTGQFTRSILIPTGLKQIPKLAVADLNKDGRPDIVYSSTRPGSPQQQQDAFYALQLSTGELGTPIKFADYVMELQIADVNGDGNLDIIGGRVRTDYAYSIYYGDGTGNFGTPQTFTTGGVVGVFEVTDVTGDGRPDIVTSDTASGQRGLALYTQNADGTFAPRVGLPLTFTTAGTPAVKVTDINRDGVPDLLIYGNVVGGASASWLPGLGGGTFGSPIYLFSGAAGGAAPVGRGLHFFDVDGDTYSDIVAVGPTSSSIPKPIAVFLNKTDEDPRVVFPPAARTRLAGEHIDFQIYFGFPITVTGSPRIALDLNGSTVYANYLSGTGRPTLTFRYTVGSTDVDLDGVQLASTTIDLNGGTFSDSAGRPATLAFPATPFSGVVVNAFGPLVQSVTRLDSAATTASTVRFAVQFSESVTGVDAADFVVRTNDGNLTGAAVQAVTGSGNSYEVSVSTGTGSGVLGLTVQGSSITGVSGASFSRIYVGGEVYTVRPQSPSNIATYYTSGHADYRPAYDSGELDLVLHASPGVLPQVEYSSDQVVTYLDSTSIVTRAADPSFDFLGVAAGQPLYLSNAAGSVATVPYLGFSGESLSNVFIGNVTTQLVGVRSSSGGQFSIYTSSGAVRMATSDGITTADRLTIPVGSHAHYNTAFSKAGTYEVDVVVSGYVDSNANAVYDAGVDSYIESGIQTIVFNVDTLGARDDAFTVNAGATLTNSVTANDPWHTGIGAFTASVVTTTANGTLVLQPGGSFTYTPLAGFTGADSFTYRLTNPRGGITTAVAAVTVNAPPVFNGLAVSTAYQTPVSVSFPKLLAKTSDPEGGAVSVTGVGAASAQGGSVSLQAGSILYTPPAGFSGADSFAVTFSDAFGATTVGGVTVQVGAAPAGGGQGTNPPQIAMLPGGDVRISFTVIPGRTYVVQRSTNMTTWEDLTTTTAASNGAVIFTDGNPPLGSGFYRLRTP